jgi:SAM-dependent methyltransferase
MDVGSSSSYVPLELAKQGNEIVAVDIRPYPLRHRSLTFVHGDITEADFGRGMPPFDVITCISTLEHIGIGHYGDQLLGQGDRLAVATMHRLLKAEGSLLLTVPFGGKFSQDDFQRVYDFPHIQGLFAQGWRLREERFHIPQGKRNWVIATREQVGRRYPMYPESNHACFWWVKEEIPPAK